MAVRFTPDINKPQGQTGVRFTPAQAATNSAKPKASMNLFSKNAAFSVTNTLKGIGKSYLGAVDEVAQAGQRVLGRLLPQSARSGIAKLPSSLTQPTEAEKPGYFGGQVSQYVAPGNVYGKVKGAITASKTLANAPKIAQKVLPSLIGAGAESATSAAITGAQGGDVKAGAVAGFVAPLALQAASGGLKSVVPKLQIAGQKTNQTIVNRAIDNLTLKYDELFTATKAGKRAATKSQQAGKSTSRFLAERGDMLSVENGKVNTQPTIQRVQQDAESFEQVFDSILKEKDRFLTPDRYIHLGQLGGRVKARLNTPGNKASGNLSKMYDEVDKMVAEFKGQFGDRINLETLNLIKRGQWRQSSVFDQTVPQFSRDVNYNFGRAAKDLLEDNLPDADVRAFNAFLGDHYDALDMLREIDGNAVKGGRLGNYFGRMVGAVAGSQGGAIGTIAGAMTGDTIARIMQANYIAGPVKRLILSRVPRSNPVYAQAQKALQQLLKTNIDNQVGQKALPPASFIPTEGRTYEQIPPRLLEAVRAVQRDPKTGRMKRIYLSTPK